MGNSLAAMNSVGELIPISLETDDAAWIHYAGGKARIIKDDIESYGRPAVADASWLKHNAPFDRMSPLEICEHFIKALVVLEVTERISS